MKARSWGMPVEIGILAGFGGRTPDMATLSRKVAVAAARGHGVLYFYWEGRWGVHAGREGGAYRRQAFGQLHRQTFARVASSPAAPLSRLQRQAPPPPPPPPPLP